ncbi:MAG: 3-oxoacyl-ACP reductase FabG [Defluviitaleaceae bacterium]|nr:3-oxoacyl-ACP reductase FabG [Defluviitaleaceae bacterium]
MKLKDKIAIVTGGSKGIGMEIAQLFAKEGAKVLATDVIELTYSNPNVEYHQLDITDSEKCKAFFDDVSEKYKKLDILVNNAGITQDALTRKMTDEQWAKVLDVNLTGLFNITRYVGPFMQGAGSGSIINISSIVGEFGNIGQANYAATKAGVIGLTKTWAKEFAMKNGGVRVNAITPGMILTDILKTIPKDLLDKFASQTALGRLGEPEEVAKTALFLASDDSSYVTGHVLSVNGGLRL